MFLDANVLARPVTRTLLLLGADHSGLVMVWSEYVEAEAERHLRPGALGIAQLRERLERGLSPPGHGSERFRQTSAKDRQVLADASASGAEFLVTADVDDFDLQDLGGVRLTAVHPDPFMAARFTRDAYRYALGQLVANMRRPPRSVEEMHGLLARQHPQLVAAHRDLFAPGVEVGPDREQRVLARGRRCVRCGGDCGRQPLSRVGCCTVCAASGRAG